MDSLRSVMAALHWALLALSLFNAMSLLWLGLTVLLTAERRSWTTWMTGGGMALGGLLYAGHAAGVGPVTVVWADDLRWWWRVGILPVLGAPYVWYVVTVAYTGVLRLRRQRVLLAVASSGAVTGFLIHMAGQLQTGEHALPMGDAIILVANPIFSVVCLALALSALRQPQTSPRWMGDEARRRARPWLVASAITILLINLCFVGTMVTLRPWAAGDGQRHPAGQAILAFDLLVSGLVALAIVLTGQAIVRYEIFTGKVLPRRGLQLHWQRALLLAAGYGSLVALTGLLPRPLELAYHLAVAPVLVALLYALLSRQAYGEYERSTQQLRPWIRSQRMYQRLLEATPPVATAEESALRSLCEDVLGAERLYLVPLGTLGPLIAGFAHPPGQAPPLAGELAGSFTVPDTLCRPLDPREYGGAVWAVPLWSERGLVGLLLLGPKRDGRLYTQEEIEIARMMGERLVDTEASTELARRLVRLQRRRLAETRVLDRRTRRVLHDEVLPHLQAMMVELSTPEPTASAVVSAVQQIGMLHRDVAQLLRDLPPTAVAEVSELGVVGALRHFIAWEMDGAFDRVAWEIAPGDEERIRQLPPLTAEVVFYAAREVIRNAAQHGRGDDPARPLHLWIGVARHGSWEFVIRDDGAGWSSSPAPGGSGQGLALHSTMMAVIGGTFSVERSLQRYTDVTLVLPQSDPAPEDHTVVG